MWVWVWVMVLVWQLEGSVWCGVVWCGGWGALAG